MNVFPKFILENNSDLGDFLIVANCTFHKELATDLTKVKGGGWWTFNEKKSTLIFHGESLDFGKANVLDIANCVKRKKIFPCVSLNKEFSDNLKFIYRNEVGEFFDLETYG